MTDMNRLWKTVLIAIPFILTASIAICALEKDKVKDAKPKISRSDLYAELELFADAVSLIRSDYVDEVDSKKLIYGAMKGMLSNLDDYSSFLEPDEFDEIKSETKGEFGGIGIEIALKDGILTVVTPLAGTPAEAAGIKPGDRIVKIDGKVTKSMTLNEAVKQMRGRSGTKVELTIWREKDQKILDVTITRAIIKIRSIRKAELVDEKIGYIELAEFPEKGARELDETLKKLESQGMDSLILDLRYNPGGLLDGAVDVAERFLAKDKMIVSIKSRLPEQNAVFKSSGKYTRRDYPLIVLVNDGSASASEIVAGAVKDNKRGIVLGTKTYGKASVQTVIPLKDGSALRLTTASYLTPSGNPIKNQGIVPDVVVEDRIESYAGKSLEEEVFEKVEKKEGQGSRGKGQEEKRAENLNKEKKEEDHQLDAAINLMKAIKVYRGV